MRERERTGRRGVFDEDEEAALDHGSVDRIEGDRTAARAAEAADEGIAAPAAEGAQDQGAVERIVTDKNTAHAATGGTSGETPAPGVPPGTGAGTGDGSRPAAVDASGTSARPGGP